MSGTAMMDDIPRSTGNTFIIYSNNLDTPKIAQSPSFSAVTGIASVSGGLDDENLKISWKNGGWQASCKKLSVFGSYSFNASVTSKGGGKRKSATSRFTLEVILLGVDDTMDYIFKQYQVGDKINETLGQKTANEILSYGVWGQLYSPDEERFGSGLFLSLVDESGDGFEVPKLTGVAARPGIYVAAIHCATDDDKNGFSGGNDLPTPVVVAIRDKDFEENQLMVVCNNQVQHNENSLRLIHCKEHPFTEKGGSFSVFLDGNVSNGIWMGRYEEQAQKTIQVTEFRIAPDNGRWQLSTRSYTKEDENLPPWKGISTAPPISGSGYPPSAGWSNDVVVAGDTHYYVPGCGFFDFKGKVNNRPIYQQQTWHTPQYDGWKNRSKEFKYDEGLILQQKEIEGKLEWTLDVVELNVGIVNKIVQPQGFAGVVVPYAPPTVEKYGSDVVRDLSFNGVSVHTPPGEIALLNNNIVGGFWRWPDERKEFVPYNGTSGDRDYYMEEISASVEKYSIYEKSGRAESTYVEGIGEYYKGQTSNWRKQGLKLDFKIPRQKLKYSNRSGDAFAWLMALDTPESDWEHTWEGQYDSHSINGMYDSGNVEDGYTTRLTSEVSGRYTKGNGQISKTDVPTKIVFYVAGGADYTTGKWHNVWILPRWQGSAVRLLTTDKETLLYVNQYPDDGSEDKWEMEYFYPADVNFLPNFLLRIPKLAQSNNEFSIDPQAIVKENSTFKADIKQYQVFSEWSEEDFELVIKNVDIRLYYNLTITQARIYTKINGKELDDSLTITITRKEKKTGTFPDINSPETTATTVYTAIDGKGSITTITNGVQHTEEVDFVTVIERARNDVASAMQQAKNDVSSCELEKTNTYDDHADGSWSYESVEEKLEIK